MTGSQDTPNEPLSDEALEVARQHCERWSYDVTSSWMRPLIAEIDRLRAGYQLPTRQAVADAIEPVSGPLGYVLPDDAVDAVLDLFGHTQPNACCDGYEAMSSESEDGPAEHIGFIHAEDCAAPELTPERSEPVTMSNAEAERQRMADFLVDNDLLPTPPPVAAPSDPPAQPEWIRIVHRRKPYTFPAVGSVVEVRRWSGDRPMVDSGLGHGRYMLIANEWEPATGPALTPHPEASDLVHGPVLVDLLNRQHEADALADHLAEAADPLPPAGAPSYPETVSPPSDEALAQIAYDARYPNRSWSHGTTRGERLRWCEVVAAVRHAVAAAGEAPE